MTPENIDAGKLARLQMTLAERRATIDGLARNCNDSREASQQMAASFWVTRTGENHWRTGDDPVAAFLTLPPEQQARVPAECKAAREIQAERENARNLRARIDALRPEVDALAQLVKACDEFVKEVQA